MGRTGKRRFWAAFRPNPARGVWERPRPGPFSICIDFQPGRQILRPFRAFFEPPCDCLGAQIRSQQHRMCGQARGTMDGSGPGFSVYFRFSGAHGGPREPLIFGPTACPGTPPVIALEWISGSQTGGRKLRLPTCPDFCYASAGDGGATLGAHLCSRQCGRAS
jgi:hypothetical protein